MKRITSYAYASAIASALAMLPVNLRERLKYTDFFCGADPVFAGLHRYEVTGDGRSYRFEAAHIIWDVHMPHLSRADRVPTVIMPRLKGSGFLTPPHIIVHELGHILDVLTEFRFTPKTVSTYAERNRYEAVAEWFGAWHCPGYADGKFDRDWLAWKEPPELVAVLSGAA